MLTWFAILSLVFGYGHRRGEQVEIGSGPAVLAKGLVIRHEVFALTVMPGQVLEFELSTGLGGPLVPRVSEGTLEQIESAKWVWTAPDSPGVYQIEITDAETRPQILLNMLVQQPFDHLSEYLNGFRIGRYEQKPFRGKPVYGPPAGFVEVTPEVSNLKVSPHFTLGQFLCKQKGGWPKYVQLREAVILKLELLLSALNEKGVHAETLHIMSAFRTPYYNRMIGNRTKYSRHLYGGAADVFVDVDGDKAMDDLNNDGKVDGRDAAVLAETVESVAGRPGYEQLVGGLAIYPPKRGRTPFVHLDVRQSRARW